MERSFSAASLAFNTPPGRVLVIATRQIGDVLLVTPLLRSLRRAWPACRLEVLVYARKGGMLAGNPDVDEVLEIEEHPRIGEYWRLFRRIGRRYELAISTLGGDRPLFYALVAAPRRVAVLPPPRRLNAWKRRLVHAHCQLDNISTHTVLQNLQLADLLGLSRHPHVVSPPPDFEALDAALDFPWRETPFAVLHPLPMWNYKRWNLADWQTLARYLIEQQGLTLALTGGGGEEEKTYLEALAMIAPGKIHGLAGRLDFNGVSALLSQARLFVGPDTAVTHLAAALGIPCLAIYGPSNPLKWSPWPRDWRENHNPFDQYHAEGVQRRGNVMLLQGLEDCVPCHEEGCDRHKTSFSRCLQNLPASRVVAAADELLG